MLAKCPVVVILQVREILQEEEDLSEIVQLVGKVTELLFFTPHRNTAYVDAAYCYRPSSVVCRSVCHTSEPCKNGCTDRDAVWIWAAGIMC